MKEHPPSHLGAQPESLKAQEEAELLLAVGDLAVIKTASSPNIEAIHDAKPPSDVRGAPRREETAVVRVSASLTHSAQVPASFQFLQAPNAFSTPVVPTGGPYPTHMRMFLPPGMSLMPMMPFSQASAWPPGLLGYPHSRLGPQQNPGLYWQAGVVPTQTPQVPMIPGPQGLQWFPTGVRMNMSGQLVGLKYPTVNRCQIPPGADPILTIPSQGLMNAPVPSPLPSTVRVPVLNAAPQDLEHPCAPTQQALHPSLLHYREPEWAAEAARAQLAMQLSPGNQSNRGRKRRKRVNRPIIPGVLVNVCVVCGTDDTPEWRSGPNGTRTLCNACGLKHAKLMRQAKKEKLEQSARSGPKPTADASASALSPMSMFPVPTSAAQPVQHRYFQPAGQLSNVPIPGRWGAPLPMGMPLPPPLPGMHPHPHPYLYPPAVANAPPAAAFSGAVQAGAAGADMRQALMGSHVPPVAVDAPAQPRPPQSAPGATQQFVVEVSGVKHERSVTVSDEPVPVLSSAPSFDVGMPRSGSGASEGSEDTGRTEPETHSDPGPGHDLDPSAESAADDYMELDVDIELR